MRKVVLCLGLMCLWLSVQTAVAQAIPMSRDYTQVYEFVDELILDGVITRQQIEASAAQSVNDLLKLAVGVDV